MKDEWHHIKEFEDYLINPLGQIKSVKRHMLSPSMDFSGYMLVVLIKDGKRNAKYVHQLMGMTFLRLRPYSI